MSYLGYANRGTVYRIVGRTLDHHEVDSVDELRQFEVERLDALWPQAMAGDVVAVAVT